MTYTEYKMITTFNKLVPKVDGDPDILYCATEKAQEDRIKDINKILQCKENFEKLALTSSDKKWGVESDEYKAVQKSILHYQSSIDTQKAILEREKTRIETLIKSYEMELERKLKEKQEIEKETSPPLAKPAKKAKVEYETQLKKYCQSYQYRPVGLFKELPDDYVYFDIYATPKPTPLTHISQPIVSTIEPLADKPKKKQVNCSELPPMTLSTPPPEDDEIPEKKEFLRLLKECNGDAEEVERRQMEQQMPPPVIKKPVVKKPTREERLKGDAHTYGLPK
jgi:hypothetical protein